MTSLLVAPSTGPAQQSQPSLQITSPADGTLISPGQSIPVTVTPAVGASFPGGVAVLAVDPLGADGPLLASPFQFSLTVPASVKFGKYSITAIGADSQGNLSVSTPISVDVEEATSATTFTSSPTSITFQRIGQDIPWRVIATFADGSSGDVTSSTSVTYSSSNPAVASVSNAGIIAATGTGSATVTATYLPENLSTNVGVSVTAATVVISPTTLTFVPQAVGTTSGAQEVTVSNQSNSPLSILSVEAGGDFFVVNNCPSTPLSAGSSCNVGVKFTPIGIGTRTGHLSIGDNFGVIPNVVSLNGNGTGGSPDFTLSLSPLTVSVTAGQSTNSTVVVLPLSGFNQTVSLSCAGAPEFSSCAVTPVSNALDGTTPVTTTLAIQTTARTAGLVIPFGRHFGVPPSAPVALGCIVLIFVRIRPSGGMREAVRLVLLGFVTALALGLATSCGGGGGMQNNGGGPPPPQGTQAGIYTITVSGTAAGLTHNTTLSLIVN